MTDTQSISAAPQPVSGRRRSAAVTVGVVTLAAAALTGCSRQSDYAQVCVDQTTQQRVRDDDCDNHRGGHAGWYYFGRGRTVPAVGAKVSGGTFTKPSSGTIARGGFKSKSFGIGG